MRGCGALQAGLREGMEVLSQARVGAALQVLFNLEEMGPVSAASHACSQPAMHVWWGA